MERLSRYILVLVTVITCAVFLPQMYWMAFEKPVRAPFVLYSCTDDVFMALNNNNGEITFEDNLGNSYTREQYEQRLPLMYTRQLLVSGTMPDTIKGVAIDMHELSKAKSKFRFKSEYMNRPQPVLLPLFESESGRATLEMPDDYFRINWRMEFINAANNRIDEKKSRLFSAALFKKGFDFPAKQISGLPTIRKAYDEGYLLVDSSNQLFHLKMINGNPYVAKVSLPDGLKFKYISCTDNKDRKFYAYLFSEDNSIYILTQDEYKLIKLPVEGFNPENCNLRIFGDLFHYNVAVESENKLKVDVFNYSDYKKTDSYSKCWQKRSEQPEGRVFAALFPARLELSSQYSRFAGFYLHLSDGFWWLFTNLILVTIHFLFLKRKKTRLNRQIFDLMVVTISGIFGYIAVNLFQNKFFD